MTRPHQTPPDSSQSVTNKAIHGHSASGRDKPTNQARSADGDGDDGDDGVDGDGDDGDGDYDVDGDGDYGDHGVVGDYINRLYRARIIKTFQTLFLKVNIS